MKRSKRILIVLSVLFAIILAVPVISLAMHNRLSALPDAVREQQAIRKAIANPSAMGSERKELDLYFLDYYVEHCEDLLDGIERLGIITDLCYGGKPSEEQKAELKAHFEQKLGRTEIFFPSHYKTNDDKTAYVGFGFSDVIYQYNIMTVNGNIIRGKKSYEFESSVIIKENGAWKVLETLQLNPLREMKWTELKTEVCAQLLLETLEGVNSSLPHYFEDVDFVAIDFDGYAKLGIEFRNRIGEVYASKVVWADQGAFALGANDNGTLILISPILGDKKILEIKTTVSRNQRTASYNAIYRQNFYGKWWHSGGRFDPGT